MEFEKLKKVCFIVELQQVDSEVVYRFLFSL